jgi:hypothetical protein
MKFETAWKATKEGKFEFVNDVRNGQNEVRYQTPSGKWKTKYIEITDLPHSPSVREKEYLHLRTAQTGKF